MVWSRQGLSSETWVELTSVPSLLDWAAIWTGWCRSRGRTPTPSSSCGAAAAKCASVSRAGKAGSSFDHSEWYPRCSQRTARSRANPASRPAVMPSPRRIGVEGGVVACGTFDFWGGNSVLDLVLDTGAMLDESIRTLRAQIKARPIVWANEQAKLWRRAGLVDVVEVPIVLSFDYTGFEDYWSSFSTGPTRIAQRLTALPSGLQLRRWRRDLPQRPVILTFLARLLGPFIAKRPAIPGHDTDHPRPRTPVRRVEPLTVLRRRS